MRNKEIWRNVAGGVACSAAKTFKIIIIADYKVKKPKRELLKQENTLMRSFSEKNRRLAHIFFIQHSMVTVLLLKDFSFAPIIFSGSSRL